MSKLILPGDTPVRGGLTVLVPRGYESAQDENDRLMICRVQVGGGDVCGRVFHAGEERAWQKHVGECARRHIAEIHAASPRTRLPIFDEGNWDPEVAEHMREVGRRMIREGRFEVKPHERAGFS